MTIIMLRTLFINQQRWRNTWLDQFGLNSKITADRKQPYFANVAVWWHCHSYCRCNYQLVEYIIVRNRSQIRLTKTKHLVRSKLDCASFVQVWYNDNKQSIIMLLHLPFNQNCIHYFRSDQIRSVSFMFLGELWSRRSSQWFSTQYWSMIVVIVNYLYSSYSNQWSIVVVVIPL